MVRVNLVNPRCLTDQHLIAEYAEILMLVAYIEKYPYSENIPREYCLGRGHQKFFKNKLKYLKKRHDRLKEEMRKRGFNSKKSINISGFSKKILNDWSPKKWDFKIIKNRLVKKIRLKPSFYRYYGKSKRFSFLIDLLKK